MCDECFPATNYTCKSIGYAALHFEKNTPANKSSGEGTSKLQKSCEDGLLSIYTFSVFWEKLTNNNKYKN